MFFLQYKDEFELKVRDRYNTRNLDVEYSIHRLTLAEKSPFYMCLRLYNCLPKSVQCRSNKKTFKTKIKKMLLAKHFFHYIYT